MTFGAKIRELRKRAGMSQQKIASHVGVSVDTVRRWEAGRYVPRADELARLAFALKLTRLDVLFNVYLKEVGQGEEERSESVESTS